ncbi:MAG: VIT1/CCC1 transporter family protein [Candidatus Nanopelagicales bacterium]|nr:VIT1/CCC1 transporter family protein [Candidatus Nanopelagicales bacterium]
MSKDPKRFLRYLEAERQAALLYRALAETITGDRANALIELADIEDAHAEHWLEKLSENGVDIPAAPTELDPADQRLVNTARATGLNSVLGALEQNEGADAGTYDEEPEALDSMSEDEREHAKVFRSMILGAAIPTITSRVAAVPKGGEPWHRVDRSGSIRAAVFGISDGLVSNTALVMGFAGASLNGSLDNSTVLFAGLAGLLAGSFSMAAGEYVSVASQRDLFRREIEMEAIELRDKPEEEAKELELIYRAKGLDKALAKSVSDKIMSDPKTALDTLAREELGLDPDQLGSPVKVAVSSFIAFAIGASVAVLPYTFLEGSAAFLTAIAAAIIALCVVGGVVGRLSGRGIVFSATRQLSWGVGAATITYAVGSLIGVSTG